MPLPNQPPTTEIQNLHNVIDSSTPDRLRTVLKDLIALTPANYARVKGQLMLPHGALKRTRRVYEKSDNDDKVEDSDRDFESEYSDEGHDAPVSRRRFEICEQCGEEYDSLLNDKKRCVWHDGELEVDWDGDFWADHDEDCHGLIDTPESRKEYPEGFIWSCCKGTGDAAGCRTTRHLPNRAKRVKW